MMAMFLGFLRSLGVNGVYGYMTWEAFLWPKYQQLGPKLAHAEIKSDLYTSLISTSTHRRPHDE